MSDLTHQALPGPIERAAVGPRPWPLAPYARVLVAGAAGLLAGHVMGGESSAYESKLLLLLRFMAAMKLAGVLLAAGLTHWRLRTPIAVPIVAGYFGALAIMALASGLIWSLGGIALGALLFHAGLLAFLVLAWRDEGVSLPKRR